MDARLQELLKLAWRTVPAQEANGAILKARAATALGEQAQDEGKLDEPAPLARSYELVLAPDATFDAFAQEHLPRLVYHLESIGAHLPHVAGIVLCVFEGEALHFLHLGEALDLVAEKLGLTPELLAERYGTHELRTAVASLVPAAQCTTLALPVPTARS